MGVRTGEREQMVRERLNRQRREIERKKREKHEIGGEEVYLYALEEGSTEASNATVQTDLWEKSQT